MARVVTLFLVAVAGAAAWGGDRPSFEVASIKPAQRPTPELILSGKVHVGKKINPARVDIGSATLNSLIAEAYRVKLFQVFGPEWLGDPRFDIQGKLPAGSSPEQIPEMLQSLLEERFKLTFHRETREFSVYALVVGKDGPKLTPVPSGYDPAATNNRRPFTLDSYAWWLSQALDRPVLDETQIKGEYVFDMAGIAQSIFQNSALRKTEPAGDQVFAAVTSLGLRLEPHKRALPVIVVDKIERVPTEN